MHVSEVNRIVYLKKSDEIRAQIFQEMPKADCAVLPSVIKFR